MTQPRLGVEPTALPPTDLATVFGRSSALRGRLQPIRDTTAPGSGPAAPEGKVARGDKPRQSTASKPQAGPAAAGDSPARGVIAYLPLSLRDRLRQRRSADSTPFADIVLDAVEATADQLNALVAARRPRTERSALFVRNAGAPPNPEPHVQVYLRLNAENVRVLDQLTTQHNSPSRSALITAALASYLDA